MVYLYTHIIQNSTYVHYFYDVIVDIYYSVTIYYTLDIETDYYIGHTNMSGNIKFFATKLFDYTLPDSLYILDDLYDITTNIENSKTRIILNSI